MFLLARARETGALVGATMMMRRFQKMFLKPTRYASVFDPAPPV